MAWPTSSRRATGSRRDTSQGKTRGKVIKRQTTETKIKTHKVAASKDNPQFIVESEKSGKRAAHKPGELKKLGPS